MVQMPVQSPGSSQQQLRDSPGAIQVAGDLVQNQNHNVALPYTFKTSIRNLNTTYRRLFDVLYLLPQNKQAFIEDIIKGHEYVLFYSNEDCSQMFVPDAYKVEGDKTADACWIVRLEPTDTGTVQILTPGPMHDRLPLDFVAEWGPLPPRNLEGIGSEMLEKLISSGVVERSVCRDPDTPDPWRAHALRQALPVYGPETHKRKPNH